MSIPASSYQWTEGMGQLTAEGMRQEYNLGRAFRKKYIEQAHLLPESYESGTMYVRSTAYERTLMSAQSLLMGFYPPGTGPKRADSSAALPHALQPIPVFSAPAKYDEIIVQQVSAEERAKLLAQYVYATKQWQQKNDALKDKYPLWSRLTGLSINNLAELELLGDALFVHQTHNAPIPAGFSAEDVATIIQNSNWAFMAQERPSQIARAYHAKLMKNIATYLYNGSQKKSKLKYVLLSAHDVTIASALSFMGAPLETAPPYASNLNFSLYENDALGYRARVSHLAHGV